MCQLCERHQLWACTPTTLQNIIHSFIHGPVGTLQNATHVTTYQARTAATTELGNHPAAWQLAVPCASSCGRHWCIAGARHATHLEVHLCASQHAQDAGQAMPTPQLQDLLALAAMVSIQQAQQGCVCFTFHLPGNPSVNGPMEKSCLVWSIML
jgi:hypothetical protein